MSGFIGGSVTAVRSTSGGFSPAARIRLRDRFALRQVSLAGTRVHLPGSQWSRRSTARCVHTVAGDRLLVEEQLHILRHDPVVFVAILFLPTLTTWQPVMVAPEDQTTIYQTHCPWLCSARRSIHSTAVLLDGGQHLTLRLGRTRDEWTHIPVGGTTPESMRLRVYCLPVAALPVTAMSSSAAASPPPTAGEFHLSRAPRVAIAPAPPTSTAPARVAVGDLIVVPHRLVQPVQHRRRRAFRRLQQRPLRRRRRPLRLHRRLDVPVRAVSVSESAEARKAASCSEELEKASGEGGLALLPLVSPFQQFQLAFPRLCPPGIAAAAPAWSASYHFRNAMIDVVDRPELQARLHGAMFDRR